LLFACYKQGEPANREIKGEIVGYLKCFDKKTDSKTILGLFIITNNKDSLLTFNIPSSVCNLDTTQLEYGINFINGGSVSFCFRNAKNGELKQFDCPPTTMQDPTFFRIENFTQVIISTVQANN